MALKYRVQRMALATDLAVYLQSKFGTPIRIQEIGIGMIEVSTPESDIPVWEEVCESFVAGWTTGRNHDT